MNMILRIFASIIWLVSVPAFAKAPTLTGAFVQGGLVVGQAAPGDHLRLDGTQVPVDDSGLFVLGFGRDAAPKANLVVTSSDGKQTTLSLKIQKRKWPVQSIRGLPRAKVTPPPAFYARIKRENQAIKTVRARVTPHAMFKSGFMKPAQGVISGVFGSQRILNGKPKSPHSGQDIAAKAGSSVLAAAPGVVSLVLKDMYYTGQTVMIDHGLGLQSVYAHMSKTLVKVGDTVARGQVIGKVGATGRATGPHLHWGVSWLSSRLDPQTILEALPVRKTP